MSDIFRTAPDTSPSSPREVTPDILADSAVHGRFLRLFGGISAGIGLVLSLFFGLPAIGLRGAPLFAGAGPAAFAVVGSLLWLIGAWQRAAALRVFREGIEVPGEVTDIYQDYLVRMNGRNPWRVVYTYLAGDTQMEGKATFWDDAPLRVSKGDRVAVLYAPGRPSRSVLWTRLDRGNPPLYESASAGARIEESEEPRARIAVEEAPREVVGEDLDEAGAAGDGKADIARSAR